MNTNKITKTTFFLCFHQQNGTYLTKFLNKYSINEFIVSIHVILQKEKKSIICLMKIKNTIHCRKNVYRILNLIKSIEIVKYFVDA